MLKEEEETLRITRSHIPAVGVIVRRVLGSTAGVDEGVKKERCWWLPAACTYKPRLYLRPAFSASLVEAPTCYLQGGGYVSTQRVNNKFSCQA